VSVYIPGLFFTGSRPERTSIAFESYELDNFVNLINISIELFTYILL
jgi:hypothetical protein